MPARALPWSLFVDGRRQLRARGLSTRRRHGESSKPCVDVAMLSSPKGGCVPAPRVGGDLSGGCRSLHVRRGRAEALWLGIGVAAHNTPDVP